jgi:hypothetical protein
VKQVLGEVPDVLPGWGEAKVLAREIAKTEVICDHSTNNRDSDNESFHDSISSLELRDGFLRG